MKYEPYQAQKTIKQFNRGKVFDQLQSGPKRFKDLLESTKLSPMGLTKILKELVQEKQIQKITHADRPAYSITKKGTKSLLDYTQVAFWSKHIQEGGGRYFQDYSTTHGSTIVCRLPWGIQDDLILDKRLEKNNPFTKDLVSETQEFIFNKIKENAKTRKITFDKFLDGDIVLSFLINYKELRKSIEAEALEYTKHISKKELDYCQKMEEGTITKKEYDQFEKLRDKTYKKLGLVKKR